MTQITCQSWGVHQGQEVSLYTLINKNGLRLCVSNYGCIVTQLWTPDHQGELGDIVLGFDDLASYQAGHPFFGAIAGRCANRIANGSFSLNGERYQLACNEVPTGQHLHGGVRGFDKYVWDASFDGDGVLFSRVSADGEEGYPGTLSVIHRVALRDDDTLVFEYRATTDQDTPVNLTNHSYYNLSAQADDICQHRLAINADFITQVDPETMLPNGEIIRVANTAFDFRAPTYLGEAMAKRPDRGLDVNYVLNRFDEAVCLAAEVVEPHSGRGMRILTNQPGLQLYNGFKLSNKHWAGKQGKIYQSCDGFCLETQVFPDSIHQPHFSQVVLKAGEIYQHHTEHQFFVAK